MCCIVKQEERNNMLNVFMLDEEEKRGRGYLPRKERERGK